MVLCELSDFYLNTELFLYIIYVCDILQNIQPVESAGWVGWERNEKGNFGPRLANMSASMDTQM